jgi:hypothetical protein
VLITTVFGIQLQFVMILGILQRRNEFESNELLIVDDGQNDASVQKGQFLNKLDCRET